eukprot:3937874-Rhodomonas_salina.2
MLQHHLALLLPQIPPIVLVNSQARTPVDAGSDIKFRGPPGHRNSSSPSSSRTVRVNPAAAAALVSTAEYVSKVGFGWTLPGPGGAGTRAASGRLCCPASPHCAHLNRHKTLHFEHLVRLARSAQIRHERSGPRLSANWHEAHAHRSNSADARIESESRSAA